MAFKNLIDRIKGAMFQQHGASPQDGAGSQPKYGQNSQPSDASSSSAQQYKPSPKMLIGVSWTEEGSLERLCEILDQHNFKTAGIQLPADYEARRVCHVTTYFFNGLEKYLSERGVEVIPLEDPN